ncbi:hypothetical protein AB0C31_49415, partial [Actinoplanes philippinensis]
IAPGSRPWSQASVLRESTTTPISPRPSLIRLPSVDNGAGPAVIGFLGDRITVLRALITVAALLGLAALIAGAVRPPVDQQK